MDAVEYLFDNKFINIIWQEKLIILAGIFSGLAVYYYFYQKKVNLKKRLKKFEEEIKQIEILEKIYEMSGAEYQYIKETVDELKIDFKNFKSEMRNKFEDLAAKVSELDKTTAVQKAVIAVYVSIAVFIIGTVLNILI